MKVTTMTMGITVKLTMMMMMMSMVDRQKIWQEVVD